MYEITNAQKLFYGFERTGIGQVAILCGSVTVPRLIEESELQRAANELFRINNGLRSYFIEREGKVYQDFEPFEERTFEVLHFKDKEELDAWGSMYATIPLKLDIRVEGRGIPKSAWSSGGVSHSLVKNIVAHNVRTYAKRIKNGIKVKPACCEVKLVYLPDACGAIVKMHHIISDAWTMLLSANQFVSILNGKTPEAYQYEEFLEHEEAYKKSRRYEKDGLYYKEQFERCPEPTIIWPNPMNTLEAKRRTTALSQEETALIKEYADANGVSPYILFLTAVSVFTRHKTKHDVNYMGSVVINRTGDHERNTAGMFITATPVLIEFDESMTFADAVKYVNKENFASFRHVKGPKPTGGPYLPYDLWVSYQNAVLDADDTAECTQYYCNYAPTLKILSIEDRSNDGYFKLHFDHNIEVTEAEVDEMLQMVLSVLRKGVEDDSRKILALGA